MIPNFFWMWHWNHFLDSGLSLYIKIKDRGVIFWPLYTGQEPSASGQIKRHVAIDFCQVKCLIQRHCSCTLWICFVKFWQIGTVTAEVLITVQKVLLNVILKFISKSPKVSEICKNEKSKKTAQKSCFFVLIDSVLILNHYKIVNIEKERNKSRIFHLPFWDANC